MSTAPVASARVSFAHLLRLSDDGGLYEHADGIEPRVEHGYCLDDIARGLVVLAREPVLKPSLQRLLLHYLSLVVGAQTRDGRSHNRRSPQREWIDRADVEDCWGRALWGLGTVAGRLGDGADPTGRTARLAESVFTTGARLRSEHLRAEVFAGLGAAEVLARQPTHRVARALLRHAAERVLAEQGDDPGWPWPEPRLRYANAALAEVVLAGGELLGDRRLREAGLSMLAWLVRTESRGGMVSVTPHTGWGPGEPRPGYDQQPLEVAALADACARAWRMTGDDRWRRWLEACRDWFLGANDAAVMMVDVLSGGGYDGLQPGGRNLNQGAESTLAAIATLQACAAAG